MTLILELEGKPVVDEKLVHLLEAVEATNSLLKASRMLGIPYSRAWEAITRVERMLGVKLVERRRGGQGGGYTRLTEEAKRLVEAYKTLYKRLLGRELSTEASAASTTPGLVYAGSHDPLLELLFGMLREEGFTDIDVAWVGSGLGLAALTLREADVAGIHLLDIETMEYNKPFLRRYWLEGMAYIVKGFEREVGFVTRNKMSLGEVIEGLAKGRLRLVNRQRGSGTRVLLDHVLTREFEKRGYNPRLVRNVKGYSVEVKTHTDVVRAVASGEADVGFCIRWAAEQYRLNFIPVQREKFDLIVLRNSLEKPAVRKLVELMGSKRFRELVEKMPGYKPQPGMGGLEPV